MSDKYSFCKCNYQKIKSSFSNLAICGNCGGIINGLAESNAAGILTHPTGEDDESVV